MKIYTKTGDAGETGLFAGPRVRKDAPRIEAYGAVDELNALLGLVRAAPMPDEFQTAVERVQHELFDLGAELATPDPAAHGVAGVGDMHIASLEREMDAWDARLPPLKEFILPGGTSAASWLHLARTVCRRAERRTVTLATASTEPISPRVIVYLNRLSDWLFVLARMVNQAADQPDVAWRPSH